MIDKAGVDDATLAKNWGDRYLIGQEDASCDHSKGDKTDDPPKFDKAV
jgi:hypothetical protein